MVENKNFPDFELPDKAQDVSPEANVEKKGLDKIHDKFLKFCERKLGKDSKVTKFIANLETGSSNNVLDTLSQIKKEKSSIERINLGLTIALIIILIFSWKVGVPMLKEIDQVGNDIEEQKQVIKMEEQNNIFLERLAKDRNALVENLYKVYAAVPNADEKAEEIISMLEDMAGKNRMVLEAIGIRLVPESQFYYDDLLGVVDVYEYTFSVESNLPNILSFIRSLRNSLRLIDIMAMEIEEGKGVYRANFSVFTYHLSDNETKS